MAAAASTRDGMAAFSAGKVEQSIDIFDEIIAEKPTAAPYLWQRGLSLYYAERFKEGAAQFATDVSVNPNDTEEAIWNFLCVARIDGFDSARKSMLRVGNDRRAVMGAVLKLFRGDTDETPLLAFASEAKGSGDEFYANLYLGLYREAQGDKEGARRFLTLATKSKYGQKAPDYMADLARVHMQRRGW